MTSHLVHLCNRRNTMLAIILIADLMILLDISVVLTGLSKIRNELGFSDAGLAWVQSAYTLTFGGLLLLGARAGDILGQRRMFMAGLALFTAASLGVALAQTPAAMIATRAIQGIGAAILAPTTLALLQTSFPDGPERRRAVAYYSAIAGIGASAGLVLGGILADWLSWRVGFLMNVPIGIAMMLATPRYIAETERRVGQFDLAGAITSTWSMSLLVYATIRSSTAGWSDVVTIAALIVGIILLLLFVEIERRAAQPIMPLRLFRSRERTGAYAARTLFLAATIGFFFFTTEFLQGVFNYTPLMTGLAFLPATLTSFALAMAVPRLARRFGDMSLLISGLMLCLLGMVWLSRISADTAYALSIALPMALFGIGQGMVFNQLTASGIAGVLPDDAGAASGVVNVAHHLGISMGLAILVAVSTIGSTEVPADDLLTHRVSTALSGAAILVTLALLTAIALIARSPARRQAR